MLVLNQYQNMLVPIKKIRSRDEDVLSGLPFGGSWKTSGRLDLDMMQKTSNVGVKPATNTKIDKPKTDKHFKNHDDEQLTNKGVDGLSGLPFMQSWKQRSFKSLDRNFDDMNENGDSKRRKLGGNSYFVPPKSNNGTETHPTHREQKPLNSTATDSLAGQSVGGRGRGRGEDINKPAWMTRQDSNSITSKSIKSGSTQTANQNNSGHRSQNSYSDNQGKSSQDLHSSDSVTNSFTSSTNGSGRG